MQLDTAVGRARAATTWAFLKSFHTLKRAIAMTLVGVERHGGAGEPLSAIADRDRLNAAANARRP